VNLVNEAASAKRGSKGGGYQATGAPGEMRVQVEKKDLNNNTRLGMRNMYQNKGRDPLLPGPEGSGQQKPGIENIWDPDEVGKKEIRKKGRIPQIVRFVGGGGGGAGNNKSSARGGGRETQGRRTLER